MPRRSILSVTEKQNLLAFPDNKDELIRHYTFSDTDLAIIRQRRGATNQLGFAVQLCCMRYPGVIFGVHDDPFSPLLKLVADQLKIAPDAWQNYGQREQIRREHLSELQTVFGFQSFSTLNHYKAAVNSLDELAWQTDKGIVLAMKLAQGLRYKNILLPSTDVIDRICAEAITRANRHIHATLTDTLTAEHKQRLDKLLKRKEGGTTTWLAWLRNSPIKPNSRHMLEHIERLKVWQAIGFNDGIHSLIHQNRLLKISREGSQMSSSDLAKFEPQRRHATLVALAIEGMATITDEIIDLNDRIIGKLFNAAKHKHQQQFQACGKGINEKVWLYGRIGQTLIDAKQSGRDPFSAIEAVMPWDNFAASVIDAQRLAQPADFDFLHHIGDSYATLRRYAPQFLEVLKLCAAPAATSVLDAINFLRSMNRDSVRKVTTNTPTSFIKPRWAKLVFTIDGIDRRYYELCALSELKNALRSGDVGKRLTPIQRFRGLSSSGREVLCYEADL